MCRSWKPSHKLEWAALLADHAGIAKVQEWLRWNTELVRGGTSTGHDMEGARRMADMGATVSHDLETTGLYPPQEEILALAVGNHDDTCSAIR